MVIQELNRLKHN